MEGPAGGEGTHSLPQNPELCLLAITAAILVQGESAGVVSLSMKSNKPGPGWPWAQTPTLLVLIPGIVWANKQICDHPNFCHRPEGRSWPNTLEEDNKAQGTQDPHQLRGPGLYIYHLAWPGPARASPAQRGGPHPQV